MPQSPAQSRRRSRSRVAEGASQIIAGTQNKVAEARRNMQEVMAKRLEAMMEKCKVVS